MNLIKKILNDEKSNMIHYNNDIIILNIISIEYYY